MGNLHAGHLELVRVAREIADFVVISIFVNPLQFSPNEDFASYPRTLDEDSAQLSAMEVDLLFTPAMNDVYPGGQDAASIITVPGISDRLCGASRPGHFQGVATVVARLFNLVCPDIAVFGEKDFQQLLVIRRMASDLAFDIEIIGVPTVRELDGLALSSRNRYLDAGQRAIAPLLYQVLNDVAGEIAAGNTAFRELEQGAIESLIAAGFQPEYFSVCREIDLAEAQDASQSVAVLAAVTLGKARLIDNLRIPGC